MRDVMLIVHFISLAMTLGTSFAFMFLGIKSTKMDHTESKTFMMNIFSLSTMGKIGLFLLFISGGYLMTPYWSMLSTMPLLISKLILFILLIILILLMTFYTKKAKNDEADQYLPKITILGSIILLTGLTIVILAVLSF